MGTLCHKVRPIRSAGSAFAPAWATLLMMCRTTTIDGRFAMGLGAAAMAGAVAIASRSGAEVTVLTASHDATLYESATGALAGGAGQYLFAGRSNQAPSGQVRRSLIRFDLSGAVPSGAEITAVRVILNLSQLNGGPADVALHRSLSPWTTGASDPSGNEGSGALAAAGDATWIHASFQPGGGALWNAPGGDFSAVASASALTTGLGLYTWTSGALLQDVRSFASSPATNFGWFLIGPETQMGVTRRFDSSESAGVGGIVPRLEIEWTAVPGPGALALLGVVLATGRRRRNLR